MRFNLEPKDIHYQHGPEPATVKVNDKERIEFPTTIYYIEDSNQFRVSYLRSRGYSRYIGNIQELRLKVEKIKGHYKLVLANKHDNSYYYFNNFNTVNVFEACSTGNSCALPEQSKVLIDPKDIMSSENIIATLEDLGSRNYSLEIRIGENPAPQAPLASRYTAPLLVR